MTHEPSMVCTVLSLVFLIQTCWLLVFFSCNDQRNETLKVQFPILGITCRKNVVLIFFYSFSLSSLAHVQNVLYSINHLHYSFIAQDIFYAFRQCTGLYRYFLSCASVLVLYDFILQILLFQGLLSQNILYLLILSSWIFSL